MLSFSLSSSQLLLSVHSMEQEEELLCKQKRLGPSTPTVAGAVSDPHWVGIRLPLTLSWTRVRSFALSVDRSRASLSLVFEVGQRAGFLNPRFTAAGQSSSFVQLKVVESWSFTKRVVFKASELVELRAGVEVAFDVGWEKRGLILSSSSPSFYFRHSFSRGFYMNSLQR